MAVQMLSSVLDAENTARLNEDAARRQAEATVANAGETAKQIINSQLESAKAQAEQLLKAAEAEAEGILKNAEKLASMRKKKVISETEKLYDASIRKVIDNLV